MIENFPLILKMKILFKFLSLLACANILISCQNSSVVGPKGPNPKPPQTNEPSYPGVPKSSIYEVTIFQNNQSKKLVVFQDSCPQFQLGYMNMQSSDQYPLSVFKDRTINWVNFSFSGSVTVQVKVLDQSSVPVTSPIRILPTRYGIIPSVSGNVITFTMDQPGQCSVEIGNNGYKNGLMIFANPPETDKPDTTSSNNYYILRNATQAKIDSVPSSYSGIYFASGVHNIGVYKVPSNIKNIYFDAGSWVYGALEINGNSNVKIFGRGVLSEAKLNYREAHCVEAINNSNNIDLEGIVIADKKYFAVRLVGKDNIVKWVKIIGGWTYNTDGIAAFAGSTVSHCFIWANDDSIKPYRNDLTISDCVVWQLNNGAVIQLSWGNAKATNVTISRIDVLHAEWNKNSANRGVISCIGDKFAQGGMSSLQQNFLIQDVTTDTPVPFIFNIRPNPASPDQIHDMTFKNWNIKMDMSQGYSNYIECSDSSNKFDGLVFDNFVINGTKLTASNWINTGRFIVKNVVTPVFQ